MTTLGPLIQSCRGKRYVAMTAPSRTVEIYAGVSALGALRPRTELVISDDAEFDWGSACHRAHLLAVSILDDAFVFEPYRAVTLAPALRDSIIRFYPPSAGWVLTFDQLSVWTAAEEDRIARSGSDEG